MAKLEDVTQNYSIWNDRGELKDEIEIFTAFCPVQELDLHAYLYYWKRGLSNTILYSIITSCSKFVFDKKKNRNFYPTNQACSA